jgi:16S rRNA (guanine527-N7)-methyltransferase
VSGPAAFPADPDLLRRLDPMLEMLSTAQASLSSVTDPARARDVHVRDSLSGLASVELQAAARIADIGSGAGFPGIPLAVALPDSSFDLIDSVGRKTAFIAEVIEQLGLDNARAVTARSEEWALGEGGEAYDAVTARAVAPLTVLAELASPLLRRGGVLVAWKGSREEGEEQTIGMLEPRLAMRIRCPLEVEPFPGSRTRHLYVIEKCGPTPEGLPRRPGMARKRPFSG